jgi:hypothetical protein
MLLVIYKKIIIRLKLINIKVINLFANIVNYILSVLFIRWCNVKNFRKLNNRKIPLILLCRFDKHFIGSSDESMEKFHLEGSLLKRKVNLANFFWDQKQNIFMYYINFIKEIINIKPDLIILSSYSSLKKRFISQPSLSIMNKIKKKFKTSFVVLWWDTCSNEFIEKTLIPTDSFIDLHVINDNPNLKKKISQLSKPLSSKIICISPSYDPEGLFKPMDKDIDVSFIGQTSSYRDYRKDYIDFLILKKVKGVFSTLDRPDQKSHEDYAEIMGRSKIGINFSYSTDMHQLKGRVFETLLSGALLLEMANKQTSMLFDEGIDYISFENKKDLLNKINYYLQNENQRLEIAKNGRNKVLTFFNGQHYWDAIFHKVGLNA